MEIDSCAVGRPSCAVGVGRGVSVGAAGDVGRAVAVDAKARVIFGAAVAGNGVGAGVTVVFGFAGNGGYDNAAEQSKPESHRFSSAVSRRFGTLTLSGKGYFGWLRPVAVPFSERKRRAKYNAERRTRIPPELPGVVAGRVLRPSLAGGSVHRGPL